MFELSARADVDGIVVMVATMRTAVALLGGNGEGAALVTKAVAEDAQARLAGGEEEPSLSLDARALGTQMMLTVRDKGEPLLAPPPSVIALVREGLASSISVANDVSGNVIEVHFALPAHHAVVSEVERHDEASALSAEDVTIRELLPDDAGELAKAIYRSYGWSYPNADMYFPERITQAILAGTRIGEVAVTESGMIAAHWGAVYLSPTCVETGGTVTDPRFRGRGLAKQLGERLLTRLHATNVIGRVREPVLTHPATQKMALAEGATIVGAYPHIRHPIAQVGITDGVVHERDSLCVAFSALQPLVNAVLYIPKPYQGLAQRVVQQAQWPRVLGAGVDAVPSILTQANVSYDSSNHGGVIEVLTLGADLIEYLDNSLADLRHSGAEYISVHLPANDPALAALGGGLPALGLAFAALIPHYRAATSASQMGDALILQWLADSDLHVSDWVFATEEVAEIVTAVAQGITDLAHHDEELRRRAAHRAAARARSM
ncbi:MAG: hypothetical protein RJB01_485 [Actinomycetota bacterium]|jgi:GNAT superfamily N-acetyltransferase